jgi:hypothetical protein
MDQPYVLFVFGAMTIFGVVLAIASLLTRNR